MAITYSPKQRIPAREERINPDLVLAWVITILTMAIAIGCILYSAAKVPQYSHELNTAIINDPTGVNGPTATETPSSIYTGTASGAANTSAPMLKGY